MALSLSELKTKASTLGQPIYWSGPATTQGATYEYTRRNSNVWIRYLPEGVKVNQKPGQFLILGTYRIPNAYQALQKHAKGGGESGPNGSFIWARQNDPKDVYMAWPGVTYEVEVYDPTGKALSIAKSGDVRPVS